MKLVRNKGIPMVKQMDEYNEELNTESKFKPRMFTYPDVEASCAVFDEEDLEYDELNLICEKAKNQDEENVVYSYEGEGFEERAGLSKQDYIEKVIQKYFDDVPRDQVIVRHSEIQYDSM